MSDDFCNKDNNESAAKPKEKKSSAANRYTLNHLMDEDATDYKSGQAKEGKRYTKFEKSRLAKYKGNGSNKDLA